MAGRQHELTPQDLLRAYAAGIFPMAETRDDPDLFWVDPRRRGIMPLDGFHISRSLKRRLLSGQFRITYDKAFRETVKGCANRKETWINAEIETLYGALHDMDHAHSVEVWIEQDLVGGVYGVTLGGAFFGESMFSRATDASKVALAYLVDRLNVCGFKLFDAQFITDHLSTLGAIEISRDEYHEKLDAALDAPARFDSSSPPPDAQGVVQRNSQMS